MAIDRNRIIGALSRLEIEGNEQGLIPAFGVFVNQLPAQFWNAFANRLVAQMSEELREAAEYLLVNAAFECGYHTGYGILNSEEWRSVIAPMIERQPEDTLHGAFAVLGAWGWAKAEIVELSPGERMLVRAYDYYEADAADYGALDRPCAYMLRGIAAAFMQLAYGGPYPADGSTPARQFECVQLRGLECGDEYGEFLVTRAA